LNIKHKEKIKIKSNRYSDKLVKIASKRELSTPGTGYYKGVEQALDRRASKPI
jgi:hypothetical protein